MHLCIAGSSIERPCGDGKLSRRLYSFVEKTTNNICLIEATQPIDWHAILTIPQVGVKGSLYGAEGVFSFCYKGVEPTAQGGKPCF